MEQPVALITGGEGELAVALQSHLTSAGWQVLAPGRQELDVTSVESVRDYFTGVSRLSLLVNNAGVRRDAIMLQQLEEDWQTVVDTCLRGAFLCSRAAAYLMAAQRSGHIVNIGSHSALTGPAGQSAYAAAKAGVTALTKSLAAELGPENIRVNCLLPGWLETKFTRDVPAAARTRALEAQVLGRFNTVEDTARFIGFLHTMSAVSGQVFLLDSRISRSGI